MNDVNTDSKRNFAKALSRTGEFAYRDGDYKTALRQYERSLALSLSCGFDGVMLQTLICKSICTQALGDYREAEALLAQAWTVLHKTEWEQAEKLHARMYHEWSVLYWRMGNSDLSIEFNQKALQALSDCHECAEEKVLILNHAALLASDLGNPSKAQSFLQEARLLIPVDTDAGKSPYLYGQVLTTQSFNELRQKNVDEAVHLFDRGVFWLQHHWGTQHPKLAALSQKFARELAKTKLTRCNL